MNWFQDRRIIAPFDFSPQSTATVELARTLAARAEDVHVLHVLPSLAATDPGVIWEAVDDERRKDHARRAVEQTLREHGIEGADMHIDVHVGDPGHVIVDLATEIGAGLILIPSHGRTGLARVLLGSVAERVVRYAPCPVLVIKHGKKG
jgi:nucleotide-binding universal stress UspA family protein